MAKWLNKVVPSKVYWGPYAFWYSWSTVEDVTDGIEADCIKGHPFPGTEFTMVSSLTGDEYWGLWFTGFEETVNPAATAVTNGSVVVCASASEDGVNGLHVVVYDDTTTLETVLFVAYGDTQVININFAWPSGYIDWSALRVLIRLADSTLSPPIASTATIFIHSVHVETDETLAGPDIDVIRYANAYEVIDSSFASPAYTIDGVYTLAGQIVDPDDDPILILGGDSSGNDSWTETSVNGTYDLADIEEVQLFIKCYYPNYGVLDWVGITLGISSGTGAGNYTPIDAECGAVISAIDSEGIVLSLQYEDWTDTTPWDLLPKLRVIFMGAVSKKGEGYSLYVYGVWINLRGPWPNEDIIALSYPSITVAAQTTSVFYNPIIDLLTLSAVTSTEAFTVDVGDPKLNIGMAEGTLTVAAEGVSFGVGEIGFSMSSASATASAAGLDVLPGSIEVAETDLGVSVSIPLTSVIPGATSAPVSAASSLAQAGAITVPVGPVYIPLDVLTLGTEAVNASIGVGLVNIIVNHADLTIAPTELGFSGAVTVELTVQAANASMPDIFIGISVPVNAASATIGAPNVSVLPGGRSVDLDAPGTSVEGKSCYSDTNLDIVYLKPLTLAVRSHLKRMRSPGRKEKFIFTRTGEPVITVKEGVESVHVRYTVLSEVQKAVVTKTFKNPGVLDEED